MITHLDTCSLTFCYVEVDTCCFVIQSQSQCVALNPDQNRWASLRVKLSQTWQHLCKKKKKKSLSLSMSNIFSQSDLNPCTHAKLLSRSIFFLFRTNVPACTRETRHVLVCSLKCSVSTHGAADTFFSYSGSPRKTRVFGHFIDFGSTLGLRLKPLLSHTLYYYILYSTRLRM